jgi:hypothetical protein
MILVLLALIAMTACTSDNPTATQTAPDPNQPPVPAHFQNERDAQPLPETMDAKLFSDPRLARVYEIAKRIPEVLAQQPCKRRSNNGPRNAA